MSDSPAARRGIIILGSTGSIGCQALSIVDRYPDRLRVVALAAGSNVELLARQVLRYSPDLAVIADPSLEQPLRDRIGDSRCRVGSGPEALVEAAVLSDAPLVLAGMVGAAGLLPTLAAVDAGKTVALANKEVLVAAGALVTSRARSAGAILLPVDSEHSAIFQCLHGQQRAAIRRLILTASGGPFANLSASELGQVTPERALQHPTWKMGEKITIDCATLMNKGLEIMEARWLFDVEPRKIDVLIHHQSIIHSLVEFEDGSVLAQLGRPSMVLPIQYSLLYPERLETGLEPLDLTAVASLTFAAPDFGRFPCLRLAREALERDRNYPVALNASNEVAVRAFLDGRIGFSSIPALVEAALERHQPSNELSLDEILDADRAARANAAADLQSRSAERL